MNSKSTNLSPLQIFTLCAASSSLGTLCLPPLFGITTDESWAAALIIAALFTSAAIALYLKISQNSGNSHRGILPKFILPSAFRRVFIFLAGLFFTANAAFIAYITADATEMYLLEETPNEVLLLALIATACIMFDAGRQYLARCCVILLLLTSVPLALFVLLSLFNIDFGELKALIHPDFTSIFRQLPAAFISCSGGAAVVILSNNPTNRRGIFSSIYGIAASASVSLLLLACSTGIFTTDGIGIFKYPYIEMARSVSIGTIALTERFDTILLAVMIIAVTMQLAVLCYCASLCFSYASGLHSHRCFSFLILPVVFAAAYYADTEAVFFLLAKIAVWGTLIILPAAVILPSALKIPEKRSENA